MISSINSLFNTFNSHGLAYSDMDPDDTGINFVTRSSKNISVQIIDDTKNITLASASSNTKEIKQLKKNKKRTINYSGREFGKKS